ncbi:group II intron maturase-specific domain-containing protein [Flavobacterium sp. W21_SRS_FM6]|uniref:group II intron maturase-specific domain-containing protein n=1 Tax=Flavobacterium sp. W21_SRS_FM6 TaxID=3240268 RepID=UPI003F8E7992
MNVRKFAVARPSKRKFLGYSFTWHKEARLKIAPGSIDRLKDKIRSLTTGNGSKSVRKAISELTPVLRGWISYFRLTQVKGVLEELDGWIRRKLRCPYWRQWKRTFTRANMLMKAGLTEVRAWASACNQRGPWWNAGASHMNQALKKKWFERLGLISLLDCHRLT